MTKCNCGTELVHDPKRKCWNCPDCRPQKMGVRPPQRKMDEERVREIFNEMFNASLPEPVEVDWRQEAKELDIPLNKETGGSRKKADVLADIASKTK